MSVLILLWVLTIEIIEIVETWLCLLMVLAVEMVETMLSVIRRSAFRCFLFSLTRVAHIGLNYAALSEEIICSALSVRYT